MGISVLCLGESGRGKSRSIKFLDPKDTLVINVANKPLPFKVDGFKKVDDKGNGNIFVTDSVPMIMGIIKKAKSKGFTKVVIDDFQYIFANEFFRRAEEKSFEKFTDIGKAYWSLLNTINNECDDDLRVYILSHIDNNDGRVKIKTIGKLVDEKLSVEGMATVVLRAFCVGGEYYFATQNNGSDTTKSPEDMFPKNEIENNLQIVDDAICSYYDIKTTKQGEKK